MAGTVILNFDVPFDARVQKVVAENADASTYDLTKPLPNMEMQLQGQWTPWSQIPPGVHVNDARVPFYLENTGNIDTTLHLGPGLPAGATVLVDRPAGATAAPLENWYLPAGVRNKFWLYLPGTNGEQKGSLQVGFSGFRGDTAPASKGPLVVGAGVGLVAAGPVGAAVGALVGYLLGLRAAAATAPSGAAAVDASAGGPPVVELGPTVDTRPVKPGVHDVVALPDVIAIDSAQRIWI